MNGLMSMFELTRLVKALILRLYFYKRNGETL